MKYSIFKLGVLASMSVMSFQTFAYDRADSSRDVYDYMNTPVAIEVFDLHDDDSDGVINARDLCPDTPVLSKIDNDGCGTFFKSTETHELKILFANGSAEIDTIFLEQIREMSDFLTNYPGTSIELRGYASRVGNAASNLILSQQRAENVRAQMISNGINANRINVVGFGATGIERPGDPEVSYAQNRRVNATVVGFKGEVAKEWTIFTTLPRKTSAY
jgi:outer membrane protein OmpA-like peptidoglycan-associated protein